MGAGRGGTRNSSGTTNLHMQLEKEIDDIHKKERSRSFNDGKLENEAESKYIISDFEN